MLNSRATAEKWTHFLASRPYVPKASLLLAHFGCGEITRICDCGCNSYDLAVPSGAALEPMMAAADHGGCALELAFYIADTNEPRRTIEINLYLDARGFFAGLDADYCGNSSPMPDAPVLIEPPFHLHGALLNGL